ncbi:MAG: L-histidine N(alpha)-methyltransferase [Oscillatoriales cyanobacterium C42_A2020_001]|nr:L-histidine N(alpha)-methyltransferase [Leptolyngbyaceae cyanobacterium C42_A2020_001]
MSFSDLASGVASQRPSAWTERLLIEYLPDSAPKTRDETTGADVVQGLSQVQKTLPPKYFYDDRGSQLFEQICSLPEYYLTRTETAILQTYANDLTRLTGECELVELGSGSSTKTRLLLNAYQDLNYPLHYRPIDVSAGILESSAHRLLEDYPGLNVHALVGTYELGLKHLSDSYLSKRMISFLGSSLGNLTSEECDRFFTQIAAALHPGDYFLLGVDLHKATAQLEAAYNDKQGITAEFNLNILRHLNQRFNGNFDLTQFQHVAFYNEALHQIEMHLRSLKNQVATLAGLDFVVELEAGETIQSEISRKFDLPTLQHQLQNSGLNYVRSWMDANQWFALAVFERRNS